MEGRGGGVLKVEVHRGPWVCVCVIFWRAPKGPMALSYSMARTGDLSRFWQRGCQLSACHSIHHWMAVCPNPLVAFQFTWRSWVVNSQSANAVSVRDRLLECLDVGQHHTCHTAAEAEALPVPHQVRQQLVPPCLGTRPPLSGDVNWRRLWCRLRTLRCGHLLSLNGDCTGNR